MSGELLAIVKLKDKSWAVSVFCCSGKLDGGEQAGLRKVRWSCYLLKHIAVKSEVLKATFGGYNISISGLPRSDSKARWTGLVLPTLRRR